jgi:hypothetical protein
VFHPARKKLRETLGWIKKQSEQKTGCQLQGWVWFGSAPSFVYFFMLNKTQKKGRKLF